MVKKLQLCWKKLVINSKLTKIDLNKGEQFKEDFKKSPFSKIPVYY